MSELMSTAPTGGVLDVKVGTDGDYLATRDAPNLCFYQCQANPSGVWLNRRAFEENWESFLSEPHLFCGAI